MQEDIFFDYLTVKEHLEYMYIIKENKVNKEQIEELIVKIDLAEKKDSLCNTLSGGQKRKLYVPLALIGDSKLVLLDEPTSGMDIMAKRELWKFLKDYKKGKIIILTTHSLDEAEYLGDRIGIIYNGRFICSGTSSFLKSNYPCGFNINLIGKEQEFDEEKKDFLFNKIMKICPDISIRINSKRIFSINNHSTNSSYEKIEKIFDTIDELKEDLGILNYTINSTSLEDVFLKINKIYYLNDISKKEENNTFMNENIVHSTGFFWHLISQIKRGLFPLWRNKIIFIIELISGLACLYIFMIVYYPNKFLLYIINGQNYFSFDSNKSLDLIKLLEENTNYIYEYKKGYLKNSDIYKSNHIKIKSLPNKPKNITDFMEILYNNSLCNIAKGGIFLEKLENNGNQSYNVYITQIYTGSEAYIFANTILFISAFLKNEYDIDASILTKFEIINFNNKNIYNSESFQSRNSSMIIMIFAISSLIGFIIFLSGLIQEKIKERITDIKHLLYLSGCNMWSYWIAFFIIDYLKLFIFNLILFLSVYFINESVKYFWIDLNYNSISSLVFIYFFSFFFSKEDSGSKFILLFFFISIAIFVVFFIYLLTFSYKYHKIDKFLILDHIFHHYFTLFYLTPFTSIILSFLRLTFSLILYNVNSKYYIWAKSLFKFRSCNSIY